ncbi:hypothetical protein QEZ54_35455 [Catellatospora sp. KI3]|uniref:hypothetical protein n=1 Tax=Catellatospora sp. KI3 TaxID=3041620 RepID=UPI002482F365|nr:hypothetical protein [Catellatospora sp. KI3]MDI1466288.1 hypothetical protein [Catellatospora sp. KI3]
MNPKISSPQRSWKLPAAHMSIVPDEWYRDDRYVPQAVEHDQFAIRSRFKRRRTLVRSDQEVARTFSGLASRWRSETLFLSNLDAIILNSAYQQIIGLGPQVIPCILDELLESGSNHWFWALAMIVGEDKAAGTTTMEDARLAWLAWGAEEGFIDG